MICRTSFFVFQVEAGFHSAEFHRTDPLNHTYSFACSKGRIVFPACPPHFDAPIQLITQNSKRFLEDSITGKDGKLPNWHLPMVQDFVDSVLDGEPFAAPWKAQQ